MELPHAVRLAIGRVSARRIKGALHSGVVSDLVHRVPHLSPFAPSLEPAHFVALARPLLVCGRGFMLLVQVRENRLEIAVLGLLALSAKRDGLCSAILIRIQ